MATTCDSCGYRTNEVKSGGGIEPKGRRIELEISHPSDMSRDVLKVFVSSQIFHSIFHLFKYLQKCYEQSETCSISIPEIELEVGQGTLGGRFTTVEGILVNIQEQVTSYILQSGILSIFFKDGLLIFVIFQLSSENPFVQGDSANKNMKEGLEKLFDKFKLVTSYILSSSPPPSQYNQHI